MITVVPGVKKEKGKCVPLQVCERDSQRRPLLGRTPIPHHRQTHSCSHDVSFDSSLSFPDLRVVQDRL